MAIQLLLVMFTMVGEEEIFCREQIQLWKLQNI